MKSGPTLNGATRRPACRSAPIRPVATVVFPLPDAGAAITTAGDQLRDQGPKVSTAHLRYLNPFPTNLGDVMSRFKTIIIPEINLGQLRRLIRADFLIDAIGINEVRGKAFLVDTLVDKTLEILNR